MTTINSDQAEHIITTMFESLVDSPDLRAFFLDNLDISDDTFVKFLENAQVSCDDVRC